MQLFMEPDSLSSLKLTYTKLEVSNTLQLMPPSPHTLSIYIGYANFLNNFLHSVPLYIVTENKTAQPVLGIKWLSVSSMAV